MEHVMADIGSGIPLAEEDLDSINLPIQSPGCLSAAPSRTTGGADRSRSAALIRLSAVAALLVGAGCGERDHAGYGSLPGTTDPGGDTGTDTSADTGDGGSDTDSDTGGRDGDPVDAVIAHPALETDPCTRLDAGEGRFPNLFALKGSWYAFFAEGEHYDTLQLVMRSAAIGEEAFGDPTTLLHGAREVDLIERDGKLMALASRMLYAVALESEDGVEWTELGYVAPDEPTYNCEGYPPVRFARGQERPGFVALGHDLNTGVFGCYERTFVAEAAGDFWEIGRASCRERV
jgi:hypothetical protein